MSRFTNIVSAVGTGIAIIAPRMPGCGILGSILMKLGVLKNVDRVSVAVEAVVKNSRNKSALVIEAACGSLATAVALYMLISGTAPAVFVILVWMIVDVSMDSPWEDFGGDYEVSAAN